MSKTEIYAGIDIGSTKVCTTVAEVYDNGRIDIIGAGITPCSGLKRGIVVDMDAAATAISESVSIAQRVSGTEIHSAIVSVSGEHISSQNSPGRIAVTHEDHGVRQEHVDRVLDASRVIVLPPEREIIHAIPRGYVVDGQGGVKDPVGMTGRRLEVETHIVTGATSFLQNLLKSAHKAEIEVEETVLSSIASGLAVANQEERELGVGVLDIGGGTTDVAVFIDGEVYYTSVLPVGGSHITHDIAVGLQTSQEEAEKAKRDYGCAKVDMVGAEEMCEVSALGSDQPQQVPKRIIAELIEPRVEEIFEMAKREIERSGFLGLLPMGIILTGGTPLMQGVAEVAGSILETTPRLGIPRGVGGMDDAVDDPIHSTAVGLILYGTRHRRNIRENGKSANLLSNALNSIRRLMQRR